MRIIVEGWRFLFHSYCTVSQFILLEMLKRPEIELFHRDIPYIDPAWQTPASISEPITQALNQIPNPAKNQPADVTLRLYCPWNFAASTSQQTWVFAFTEWGIVSQTVLDGMRVTSLRETPVNSESMVITSSQWSKAGLSRSGIEPNRIAVIPLGVDANIYQPLTDEQRTALRKKLGWEDYFIFLNVGGCTGRKGIRYLLKAFAAIMDRYPHARLVLKGADILYPSQDEIAEASKLVLSETQREKVAQRVAYTGDHLSVAEVVQLYQAADAYVSPYLAEGFNLPVLEAAACGLPVICTQGGPTDDFTHPDFAMAIESEFKAIELNGENVFVLAPNLDHLITLMERAIAQPALAQRAKHTAPAFVRQQFTWKHTVDQLLDALTASKTKGTIDKLAFKSL